MLHVVGAALGNSDCGACYGDGNSGTIPCGFGGNVGSGNSVVEWAFVPGGFDDNG